MACFISTIVAVPDAIMPLVPGYTLRYFKALEHFGFLRSVARVFPYMQQPSSAAVLVQNRGVRRGVLLPSPPLPPTPFLPFTSPTLPTYSVLLLVSFMNMYNILHAFVISATDC